MLTTHRDSRLSRWVNRWRGPAASRVASAPGGGSRDGASTGRNRTKRSFRPSLEQLEERRLLYAGMLDHAFGTDGMTNIDLSGAAFGPPGVTANAVAIDTNININNMPNPNYGKIVVVGGTISGVPLLNSFLVARLNPDGSLDTSFNGSGTVQINFASDVGNGVAIQSDGKIVVVGTSNGDVLDVFRLNTNGTRDTSFDNNQGVLQLFGGFQANAVALQPDGKIVVAGTDDLANGNKDFLLVRLNSNGTPDVSFGFFGATTTDFPSGGSSDVASANSVAIEPDGTIVAAGSALIENGVATTAFAIAVYNPDGTPDADFNAVGRVTTPFKGLDSALGVAIQADGKIVAAGSAGMNAYFALARYNPDGTLDATFGSGGKVTTNFPNGSTQSGSALVLQPDGKIVVAGSSFQGPLYGINNFALARYNSDGSLEKTFSFDGLVTTDLFGGQKDDSANALALQPDGKLVAVGDSFNILNNPIIGVARYNGDAGQLQFSSPSVVVNESAGSVALQVTRTNGGSGAVTVDYTISDGTATAGADYTANVMSGTVMFGDGQTGSIPIPAGIIDDTTLEGGRETFRVTLSNPSGGATLGSPSSETVTILDPDMVVTPPNATEGQPFSGVVATFKGSNPSVPIGDYSASINWGDNQSTAGTITPDPNGGFDISGMHTYAEEQASVASVTVSGADNLTINFIAVVADAPLSATRVPRFAVTGGVQFTHLLATFTDADPAGTPGDYTALINWGDNSSVSFGTITPDPNGGFDVTGTHTYPSGTGITYTATVTITDQSVANFSPHSTAMVTDILHDPSLPNSIVAMSAQSGQWWVAQSNGSGFTTSMWAAWNPNVTWVDMVSGDFTGNGKTDFAARDLHSGQWWVALSTGSSFTTSLWTAWNPNVTWVDVKAGDFTGDGKFDIAGRVLQTGQWWVAESTGSGFTNSLWTTWNPRVTWLDVSVGDFNGDGMADITGRVLQSGQWWVAHSTGTSFSNSLYATWSPLVTWVDVRVGDFNGDGMDDIVGRVQQNGQWWMAQSTGSTFASSLWGAWSPNVTWVDVQVGDFTGDGQLDIIGRVLQTGQWWLAQSNGSAFTNHLWGQWSPNVNWVDVQIGDFNGDGKADITGRIQGTGQWWTSLSTGSGFTTSLWANWSSAVTWTNVSGGDYA